MGGSDHSGKRSRWTAGRVASFLEEWRYEIAFVVAIVLLTIDLIGRLMV